MAELVGLGLGLDGVLVGLGLDSCVFRCFFALSGRVLKHEQEVIGDEIDQWA